MHIPMQRENWRVEHLIELQNQPELNQVPATGKCHKSVKLLIMGLIVAEQGCLIALKVPH